MANIKNELTTIAGSIYGKEMRPAIHDAIEKINEESEKAYESAVSSKDSSQAAANAAQAAQNKAEEYASAAQAIAGAGMATEDLAGFAKPDGKTIRSGGDDGTIYAAYGLVGKTALFFGDSIVWGQLAEQETTQAAEPYPVAFGNLLGCEVINAAVRGATASVAHSNNFAGQIADNEDNIANVDICFVSFGTNDYNKGLWIGNGSTKQSFYKNYEDGIDSIQALNPNIDIVMIIPPTAPARLQDAGAANGNGEVWDEYVNAMIEIAASRHLAIVDFGQAGINAGNVDTYYLTDKNHLTQEGYTLLGEYLARVYKTGTFCDAAEFYNKNYRVAANILPPMVFADPVDTANAYHNGVYWSLPGDDTAGLTAIKNVALRSGNHYQLAFLAYHAGDRTVEYTVTLTNTSDTTKAYIIKKKVTGTYNRITFDFYTDLESGLYTLNIVGAGDHAQLSSVSLSFAGFVPEVKKRKTGVVEITSNNTISVTTGRYVNSEFAFNLQVTVDSDQDTLATVDLNTIDTDDTSAYTIGGTLFFVGIDATTGEAVVMGWQHDSSTTGTYLLKLMIGAATTGHTYIAQGMLYMGRPDAVTEVITQEY